MANDLWTTVEEAVLAALKAGTGRPGQDPGHLPGGLADRPAPGVLALSRRFWCSCARAGGSRSPWRSYDLSLEFTIFVVARGDSAKRREANGVYQILAGVRAGLVASGSGAGVATPQSHQGRAVVEQPGIFRVRGPLWHCHGAGSVKLTRRENHDPVHPEFFGHP